MPVGDKIILYLEKSFYGARLISGKEYSKIHDDATKSIYRVTRFPMIRRIDYINLAEFNVALVYNFFFYYEHSVVNVM